jgi:uncharacterized delta-60 repeat protein
MSFGFLRYFDKMELRLSMRYTKFTILGIWLVIFYCFFSAVSVLAVDSVDAAFGNDGFTVKDFGIGDDEALALAVQEDGKILVAGYSSNGAATNLTVARYLDDGVLDISFNYDGVFTLNMGSGDSIARSVVVQNDGRILVAGSTFDSGPRLAVVALTEDGYLDQTFGNNGQVVLPVQDNAIITTDLEIAVDGSILISATVENSDSSSYPMFVKMSSGGKIATDFGENGVVQLTADYPVEVYGFVVLEEGGILAAGSIEHDEIMQAGLLRLNANGTLDTTFGNDGEFLLELEGSSSRVNDILAESVGSILLAGYVDNGNFREAFAVRFEEDGTLDPYFAGTGLFKSDLGYDSVAHSIAVQQDKSVVLAGFGSSGQGKDVIVWSISGDNAPLMSSEDVVILDAEQQIVLRALSLREGESEEIESEDAVLMEQLFEFVAPPVVTDIASDDDIGYAAVALESGQVLTAGSSGNGTDKDFVLVRYTSENIAATLSAGSSAAGVATGDLRVITSPVVDITRVGAVSGGTVSVTTSLSCDTSCTAQGTSSLDNDDRYDKCYDPCQAKRTITSRGVVYAVYQNPVYRAAGEVDTATDPPDETVGGSHIYDTVRSGQTEDGRGIGSYGSDIQEITPNVTYYVRAYAITTDTTVIYGNQLTFKTDDACFIATAAYGTLLDGHVTLLRQFRDAYMMPYSLGRKIVGVYYRFSPAVADIVNENLLLRGVVRIALWPFVGLALFMLKASSTIKIMGIVFTIFFAGIFLRMKTSSHQS